MEISMYEEHLARVPGFQDLSPRALTWLSAGCHERTYDAGGALALAGHASGGLLILLRGRAMRTQPQPDGSELPTGQLAPGAVIGEMSLYGELPHPETVTALEPCVALALPRWDFQATLRETPDIAIKLLGVLSARLLAAEQREHRFGRTSAGAANDPPTEHPTIYPSQDEPQEAD